MSTNSNITRLERAVFFRDAKGNNIALPHNNSMRIDLLSSTITKLSKDIKDVTIASGTDAIKKLIEYMTGENMNAFSESTVPKPIITLSSEDAGNANKYKTVISTLQELYEKSKEISKDSNIILNENKDVFMQENGINPITGIHITDEDIEDYKNKMSTFPECFQPIYDAIIYLEQSQGQIFEKVDYIDIFDI